MIALAAVRGWPDTYWRDITWQSFRAHIAYERDAARRAVDAQGAADFPGDVSGHPAAVGRSAGRTATSGGWGTPPPREVLDLLPTIDHAGVNN